ncbi:hypothetical protein Ndes2526B_g04596 [Nannochloris sp. 'desiccata']
MLSSIIRSSTRRSSEKLISQVRLFTSSSSAMSQARPGEDMFPIDDKHKGPTGVIDVPKRILMGPGPANADPRILAAQSLPLLGHMHPPFLKIMDEVQQGLRYLFQTDSPYTLCVSGTGHAGMEACIANLVEPGETVIVGNKGIWGERVCDMADRFGANVVELKKEADTVCSLGGVPIYADKWGIDAIYSGSQKCLSAPPGGAPLFLSPRAIEKIKARKTKVRSYYLDLNLVGKYWGWFGDRMYHHTGMVSMQYAMREALALVADEGMEQMWARHDAVHKQLWEGLSAMGLEPFVKDPKDRLCTVNTIKVPEGVDWAAVCKLAMDKYSVEIAGGLGPTAGQVWRVGLMGYNAHPENVALVLDAFRDGLTQQGFLKN